MAGLRRERVLQCRWALSAAQLFVILAVLVLVASPEPVQGRMRPHPRHRAINASSWLQFGRTPQHTGSIPVTGQNLSRILLSFQYDPTVPDAVTAGYGYYYVHYMTPLTEGNSVYMVVKMGPYNGSSYAMQTWGVTKFIRRPSRAFVRKWTTWVDYKAVGGYVDSGMWEPVFHGLLANGYLYVPGGNGTALQIEKSKGRVVARIQPPGDVVSASSYVSSPFTATANGYIYYTVIRLSPTSTGFYSEDLAGSWLVQIRQNGKARTMSFLSLIRSPPTTCLGQFHSSDLPWPPSTNATPPAGPCGSVRAALNAAPAISPRDGTVYLIARTHFNSRYAWLVAVKPSNLKRVWASTLRERFNDGCGTPTLPPNSTVGGCREGAKVGVDPRTNLKGGGRAHDASSASPVVAPDGSIYYGAWNRYNYDQGHMMRFAANGTFLSFYGFGWDSTPGIYEHDGTFSVISKDNHYNLAPYCDDFGPYCPPDRGEGEAYFITQLSPDLQTVEWQYTSTQYDSCVRNLTTDVVTCTPNTNPHGFRWGVNAPVIDKRGVVYVNSEDGFLYAINQGGGLKERIFQQTMLGASYTPASLGPDGLVYSQNSGRLIVVGEE